MPPIRERPEAPEREGHSYETTLLLIQTALAASIRAFEVKAQIESCTDRTGLPFGRSFGGFQSSRGAGGDIT